MINDRQREARSHSDLYQKGYRKILNALIFSCVMIFFLILGIGYYVIFKPTSYYYATTLGGLIIPMIPTS